MLPCALLLQAVNHPFLQHVQVACAAFPPVAMLVSLFLSLQKVLEKLLKVRNSYLDYVLRGFTYVCLYSVYVCGGIHVQCICACVVLRSMSKIILGGSSISFNNTVFQSSPKLTHMCTLYSQLALGIPYLCLGFQNCNHKQVVTPRTYVGSEDLNSDLTHAWQTVSH